MNDDNPILYYAPRTRASSVLTLLEELDVPYELRVLNFQLGEQRKPEYLAVNPLGKVPAILPNGALVTELGAIFIYLADAFPQKGLAPAPYAGLICAGSCSMGRRSSLRSLIVQ